MNTFWSGLKKGFTAYSHAISDIINAILLSIVYLVGVGLTSLFAKLIGKHFLDLKVEKKAKTYWEDLRLGKKPLDEYYRQF